MSDVSNYAENIIADYICGNFGASPSEVYLALFTSAPGETDSGTEVESGGSPTNGYARKAVTFKKAVGGVASSNSIVTFTAAGDDWGVITHIGLYDSPSGGNLLASKALTASQTILDGSPLSFAEGGITFTQT